LDNETRPSAGRMPSDPKVTDRGPDPSLDRDGGAAMALPPEVYERLCSTAQVLNLTPEDTLVYAAKHLGQLLLPEEGEPQPSGSRGAATAFRRPTGEDPSRKWDNTAGQGLQSAASAPVASVPPAGGAHPQRESSDRDRSPLRPDTCLPSGGGRAAGGRSGLAAAPPIRYSASGGARQELPRTVAFFALLTLLPAAAALLVIGVAPRIPHSPLPSATGRAARAGRSHASSPWMVRQVGRPHPRPSFPATRGEITRGHAVVPRKHPAQHRQLVHRPVDWRPKQAAYRRPTAARLANGERITPAWHRAPARKQTGWLEQEPLVVRSPNEYRSPSAEESFRVALERERLSRHESAEQFRLAEERERISRQQSAEQFRLAEERERMERQRSEAQLREVEAREKARL
jgi:hypothetical protein